MKKRLLYFNDQIVAAIKQSLKSCFKESYLWVELFNSLTVEQRREIENYIINNNIHGLNGQSLSFPVLEQAANYNTNYEFTLFIIRVLKKNNSQKYELDHKTVYRTFMGLFRTFGDDFAHKPVSQIFEALSKHTRINYYPKSPTREGLHYSQIFETYLVVQGIFATLNDSEFLGKFKVDTINNLLYRLIPIVFPEAENYKITFRVKGGDSHIYHGGKKYNLNSKTASALTASILDIGVNEVQNAVKEAKKHFTFIDIRLSEKFFAEKLLSRIIANF